MIDKEFLRPPVGATSIAERGWNFTVWAPRHQRLELQLIADSASSRLMQRNSLGYHSVVADDVQAGAKYFYRFGGSQERPDPASRRQPEGVHGPSELIDNAVVTQGIPLYE